MKIQSLAVIMAIIILPIVIVLSYYIHSAVDTIVLQTSYDTKLIDSTHDAMTSFEINTANEDLSSVADSLRSIIDASTNVFFNTLATNLGISNAGNAAVDSYIPAILYTLYDGYYIYSPTRIPTVLTYQEDDIVYVGDRGVEFLGKITYINESNESVTIGKYSFNEAEYAKEKDENLANNEPEAAKTSRQEAIYNNLGVLAYEYGQMLYLNNDGTYSTQLHTDSVHPSVLTNTKYKQKHVLKSYMPYSARYQRNNDFDITINYTLDNYITVEGNIEKVYYSKTGYLIAKDTVTSANVGGITDILTYNEITAEEMILSGEYDISLKINPLLENNSRVVDNSGSEIIIDYHRQFDDNGNVLNYTKLKEKLSKLYENQDANIAQIQNLEYELANLTSIAYYVKAQIFSNWVYENLHDLKACDISEDIAKLNENIYTTDGTSEVFHKFIITDASGNITYKDETLVFDSAANPELEDSPFFTHKLNVMRNDIQYNLNLAISAYNEMLQTRNVQMPVIKESEWDQLLTRVSIASFMQGLKCGMKTYNNYAIASSTNNELTVIPTEIYYTYKEQYNTSDVTHEYHKIDCDDLLFNDGVNNKEYISFKSKEIKYDKIYNKESKKYLYDHRNNGCYRCAITSNYEKDVYDENGNPARGYSDDIKISLLSPVKQKAYFVAIGKERQNLYKTNALTDSNGYEIYYNGEGALNFPTGDPTVLIQSGINSQKNIENIREIEITLSDLKCTNDSEATVNFKLVLNNNIEIDYNAVLNLAQSTPQTVVIPVHVNDASKLTSISLKKVDLIDAVTCKKLNVRIVYE